MPVTIRTGLGNFPPPLNAISFSLFQSLLVLSKDNILEVGGASVEDLGRKKIKN